MLLGIGCCVFFTWSGMRKVQTVTDALLQPLIAGRITAPVLEELQELKSRIPKSEWESD